MCSATCRAAKRNRNNRDTIPRIRPPPAQTAHEDEPHKQRKRVGHDALDYNTMQTVELHPMESRINRSRERQQSRHCRPILLDMHGDGPGVPAVEPWIQRGRIAPALRAVAIEWPSEPRATSTGAANETMSKVRTGVRIPTARKPAITFTGIALIAWR